MNCWLLCGMVLSTRLLAQQVTNPPAAAPIETPAPAPISTNATSPAVTNAPVSADTNAPSAKPAKKKNRPIKKAKKPTRKQAAAELKTVPLVAGPAIVVANHVNVRGQPRLQSEVVGHLNKGQQVSVIEEVTRNNSGPTEPSAWAKIQLPPDIHVWVNTRFIDATNNTVLPRRLNFRSGAGENYSILGRLQRGDAVKTLGTKAEWTEIEAPTNAYAFIAAQYLKQEAPGAPAEVAAANAPAPIPTAVPETPPVATAPTEPPAMTPPATETATTNALSDTNVVAEPSSTTNEAPATASEEPPPKRIVEREGLVRGTFSIQAPTHFELISMDNGKTIDYLYTPSPNLDLRRYKGLHIIVTGEEALDERWGNTPVITIQKIQVLE